MPATIKTYIMKQNFHKKPGFIIVITIIFYLVTGLCFFGINALLGIDNPDDPSIDKSWNVKYSLIQAIIPTLILLYFILFQKKKE